MYTYNKLKNGDKTLPQVEEDQRKFRSELNEITRGPKNHKYNQTQQKTLKNFIIQDKKLLIYSMITQELDLKPFTRQNKMKQRKNLQKQDLKY